MSLSGNRATVLFLEFLTMLGKTSWFRVMEPWGVKELEGVLDIISIFKLLSRAGSGPRSKVETDRGMSRYLTSVSWARALLVPQSAAPKPQRGGGEGNAVSTGGLAKFSLFPLFPKVRASDGSG